MRNVVRWTDIVSPDSAANHIVYLLNYANVVQPIAEDLQDRLDGRGYLLVIVILYSHTSIANV